LFTYVKANSIGRAVELSIKALDDYGIFQQRENQDREDCCKEIQLCLHDSYSLGLNYLPRGTEWVSLETC